MTKAQMETVARISRVFDYTVTELEALGLLLSDPKSLFDNAKVTEAKTNGYEFFHSLFDGRNEEKQTVRLFEEDVEYLRENADQWRKAIEDLDQSPEETKTIQAPLQAKLELLFSDGSLRKLYSSLRDRELELESHAFGDLRYLLLELKKLSMKKLDCKTDVYANLERVEEEDTSDARLSNTTFDLLQTKVEKQEKSIETLEVTIEKQKKTFEQSVSKLSQLVRKAQDDLAFTDTAFQGFCSVLEKETGARVCHIKAEEEKRLIEITEDLAKLGSLYFENYEKTSAIEAGMRKKKAKLQNEIKEEISTLDEELQEKRKQVNAAERKLCRDRREYKHLHEKFTKFDIENAERQKEEALKAEQERIEQEKVDHPARQLQKLYRGWKAREAYKVLQKRGKKGKKGKGKGKK